MVDLMLCNRLEQLQVLIEKLHLSYLQTDECLQKIDQRKKLENFIREYLCLVPHNQKFLYAETAEVLHRSAAAKEDFSGYRAASAWNAIATYASNLLSQPWRKEYKVLKLFGGFYKHEIEAHLVGAETMLIAMGYRPVNQTTMVLEGPIDPDKVSNVSRDSLVAFVECQLMKNIWEDVSSKFNCGWFEILKFRENHICSPSMAVRAMVYHFHQHQYQEQQQQQMIAYHQQSPIDMYGTSNRYRQLGPGCLYGQTQPTNVPYYYPQYVNSHTYTLPAEPRYSVVQHTLPYSHSVPIHTTYHHNVNPVIKAHDLYPVNGHQHCIPSSVQNMQVPYQNGYSVNPHHLSQVPVSEIKNPVPTGKLIELDMTPPQGSSSETLPNYSTTDSPSSSSAVVSKASRVRVPTQNRTNASATVSKKNGVDKQEDLYVRGQSLLDLQHLHLREDNITLSQKAKEDGIGTFESWDYVFKDLESQGYTKDLGERPDILSRSPECVGSSFINHEKLRRRSGSLELERTLQKLRMEEFTKNIGNSSADQRNIKINEAWQKVKSESEASNVMKKTSKHSGEAVDISTSVYDNMSSPSRESPLRERPITYGQGTIKPINTDVGFSKPSTKTLPREGSKRRDSEKSLRADVYASATLDPRKLRDCLALDEITNGKKVNTKQSESVTRGEAVRRENPNNYAVSSKAAENKLYKEKWQCKYCTYLNIPSQDICEMCHKSKSNTEIPPLATGGRECPKCTLVNVKGVEMCEACGSSLKDSPTYI